MKDLDSPRSMGPQVQPDGHSSSQGTVHTLFPIWSMHAPAPQSSCALHLAPKHCSPPIQGGGGGGGGGGISSASFSDVSSEKFPVWMSLVMEAPGSWIPGFASFSAGEFLNPSPEPTISVDPSQSRASTEPSVAALLSSSELQPARMRTPRSSALRMICAALCNRRAWE